MSAALGMLTIRTLNASKGGGRKLDDLGTFDSELQIRHEHLRKRSRRASSSAAKNSVDLAPDFGAAGKSMPVRTNQTDQLVAFVDGNEVIPRGVRTSAMTKRD